MGIKSYIRERLIAVVKYAIRDELDAREQQIRQEQIKIEIDELEEDIVTRLDKQIERWTWERFKRTNSLFDVLSYDLEEDVVKGLDNIKKELSVKTNQEKKEIINNIGDRIVSNRNLSIQKNEEAVKKWTWERYVRLRDKEELLNYIQDGIADIAFELKKNKYIESEKIRIVLLYQMPSMWPSWESLYYACIQDKCIDIKVVYLHESVLGDSRTENAEKYLSERNIPFERFEEFDLENYHPHILFIQTPYDSSQRIRAHWSARIKSLGIRICYIPYGMEITDMPEAHNEQYNSDGLINCWRIYTFSDEIKKEYYRYSLNGGAVRVLGLPKFDSFFMKNKYPLHDDIVKQADGKKIILWKLHFPKIYNTKGNKIEVTPDFCEYIKFSNGLSQFKSVFFVFMPHPLFKEQNLTDDMRSRVDELFECVKKNDNVYIDVSDDYRNSLLNADAIIIDRSAVMVEAAAVGVPVLFMSNPDFVEPKPQAINPLIESYYQGTTSDDMVSFVEMCIRNEDYKKTEREQAFMKCIPFFDGNSGERIKADLVDSIRNEV